MDRFDSRHLILEMVGSTKGSVRYVCPLKIFVEEPNGASNARKHVIVSQSAFFG